VKRSAVIAILICALGSAGAASAAPRDARLTGLLRLCGGPPGVPCRNDTGNMISVLNSNRRVVARQRAHDGRFSFLLEPGSYTLSFLGVRRQVTLHAHQTVHENFTISGIS
jgi:hypothetical protein